MAQTTPEEAAPAATAPPGDLQERTQRLDIHPSDRLNLAPGHGIGPGVLIDQATGRALRLNGVGWVCVESLAQTTTFDDLVRRLTEQFPAVDEDQIRTDVFQFLATMDLRAQLHVRKAWRARLHWRWMLAALRRLVTLDWPMSPARRHPGTLFGVLLAAVRVSRIGIAAAVGLSLGLAVVVGTGIPLLAGGQVPPAYVWFPVVFALVQLVLMWVHEAGHLLMLRRLGVDDHYVTTRSMAISIAHSGAPPAGARLVAVAGPAAAIALGAAGASLLWLADATGSAAFLCICAGLHAYSFLPWTSDGRMLWYGENKVE